jgi:hypothetical protein
VRSPNLESTRASLFANGCPSPYAGQGSIAMLENLLDVYTILLRYWDWTPEEDVRPLIFLMSD